jgi:hypothetical protein
VAVWVGVDVGGKRKGFDVAVIDDRRVLALQGHLTCRQVVDIVMVNRPAVVAVDSPLLRARRPDCSRRRAPARQVDLRHPLDARRRTCSRQRVLRLDSRGTCPVRRAGCPRHRGHRGLPDGIMDSLAWQARPADPRGLDPAGTGSPRPAVRARAHEPRPARRSCRGDDGSAAQHGPDRNDGRYRRSGRPLVTCESQG